jgi:hypothetical protein
VADPALARRAQALALGQELDPLLALSVLRHVAEEHPDLGKAFYQANRKQLFAGRTPLDRAMVAMEAYAGSHNAAEAEELVKDVHATLPQETWQEVDRAAARIRFDDMVRREVLPAIDRWAVKP